MLIHIFLDKNSWKITDAEETMEETIDSYRGCINRYDVSESAYESTYKKDLKEYIVENKFEYVDDFKDYIQELKADYKKEKTDISFKEWLDDNGFYRDFDEWIENEKKDDVEHDFTDNRYSDDYCPIWNTAWEFPSNYTAEELNEKDINGLIFFEINKNNIYKTFVSLSGCGMDMSPSIYCAYMLYSTIKIDDDTIKEMLCQVQKKGLDYMGYVMGKKHLDKFVKEIGEEMAIRMDKRGRAEYKKFDEQLKKLTVARDKGDLDNATAGLLGMMSFFQTQECKIDEELNE